jgi:hypothetical protein
VSRILSDDGDILAEWLLMTNVMTVDASEIALWYFWRWQIECFFKLLKKAGHDLESWQRVISAQKANTENAFSLPGLALSTANLYNAVQPGGTLFGLQASNPVDTAAAYKGPSTKYGLPSDPLVGKKNRRR